MEKALKQAALACTLLVVPILLSAQTALEELRSQAKEAGVDPEITAPLIQHAGKTAAPAASAGAADIERNAAGWPAPKRYGYKFVSMEYVERSDIEKGKYNKVFVVTFRNKKGDVLISQYFKTHPIAYTIRKAGEEPYTIVDTRCRKVYDTKYPGAKHEKYPGGLGYEMPQCALDLYTTQKPGAYNPGQFEGEQTGSIKLNTPQPDDFNPLDPDNPDPQSSPYFRKACEWHPVSESY